MDRRTFLKMLGATSVATIIKPSRVLAAVETEPARFVGEYALVHEGEATARLAVLRITPLILSAPPGQSCRAIIRPAVDDPNLVASVTGVISGNGPAEVLIERVAPPGAPSYLATELDAYVLNTAGVPAFGPVVPDIPLPVDWGVISDERPLELDYRALGEGRTLYLGLVHTFHDKSKATLNCTWPSKA